MHPAVRQVLLGRSFSLDRLFANASGFDFSDMDVTKTWGADSVKLLAVDGVGTRVSTSGQNVQSILDKSTNFALGAELVTNGDFSGGSTGWSLDAGWAVVAAAAKHTAGSAGDVINSNTTSGVGDTYRTQVTVSGRTAGQAFTKGPFQNSSIAPSADGGFADLGLTTTANASIRWAGASAFDGSIDNLSCKKVTANSCYQATSASRPIWQANSGKPYLNFDGSDDWLLSTLVPGASMTLAACFRATTVTTAAMGSATTSTTDRVILGLNASGQLAAGLGSDGLSAGPIHGTDVVTSSDVVGLLTYTATTYELWGNGVLLSSGAVSGTPNVGTAIAVGGYNAGGTINAPMNGRFYGGVAVRRADLSTADKIALMRQLGARADLSF